MEVRFLTKEQIQSAFTDEKIRLSDYLTEETESPIIGRGEMPPFSP